MGACCPLCFIETNETTCPFCLRPTLPGSLSNFCPHGERKPYRGWPCPRCREIEIREIETMNEAGLLRIWGFQREALTPG